MAKTIEEQILSRIYGNGRGWAFLILVARLAIGGLRVLPSGLGFGIRVPGWIHHV